MNSITIEPLQISQNMVIERVGNGTATGGTTNYEKLKNLPTLNGKPIIGDMVEEDPTVSAIPAEDIVRILK